MAENDKKDMSLLAAHVLHEMLVSGETTSTEITRQVLGNIERREPKIKAYLLLMREQALRKAEEVDERIRRGESLGPLAGIPLALKDNMCMIGTETTCASKILKGYIAAKSPEGPWYRAELVEQAPILTVVPKSPVAPDWCRECE